MTLATNLRENLRDNKAVQVAAGAGDLAAEKLRDLPETMTKLRESATENVEKARSDMRGTVSKYQDELRGNVARLRERVDTKDLPGVAVSYVTHSATRVVELIDELAERGRKVVARGDAAAQEIESGARETARRTKEAAAEGKTAGESRKTAQSTARKSTGGGASSKS
jgi:polyhydroxyalkanoate synthesis regulator phasin